MTMTIHLSVSNLSIKARSLCLSVCVCVCVRVCVCMCSSNISADQDQADLRVFTWLLRVSRVCNVAFVWTVNNLFQKCFTNSTSIANHSHHSHMRTRANHCRAHRDPPPLTCSGASWTVILPAVRSCSVLSCATKLTAVD